MKKIKNAIRKICRNIVMFQKRTYLFLKYKLNKNSGKLLIQRRNTRGLGLTTMMIKDCKKNGYYLFVPSLKDKYVIAKITEKLGYEINVLIPSDNLLGKRSLDVVIDNHCSFADVYKLLNDNQGRINIVNGFVYEPLAR